MFTSGCHQGENKRAAVTHQQHYKAWCVSLFLIMIGSNWIIQSQFLMRTLSWIHHQKRQSACQGIEHQNLQATLRYQPFKWVRVSILRDFSNDFLMAKGILHYCQEIMMSHLQIRRRVGAHNGELQDKRILRKKMNWAW